MISRLPRHLAALPLAALLAFGLSASVAVAPIWIAPPLTVLLALALGARGLVLAVYALFWPLLVGLASLALPAWAWALAALALFAVCRHAMTERVPLFLSSRAAVDALADSVPQGVRFADLGAGTGSVVVPLARRRPDLTVIGVESAWLPWLLCRWRGRDLDNLRVRYGDIWKQDWHGFDVVYVYLSPAPMSRVWARFRKDAPADGCLISNTFSVDGAPPDRTVPLDDAMDSQLYFWKNRR